MDDNPPPVAKSGISRQAKHRQKRRSEGMCAREGCPVYTQNDYYCEAHKSANRISQRGRRSGLIKRVLARLAASE